MRIELLGARREADEVDEDDADDPPLLPVRRFLGQGGPAREAEARDFRVVLAAGKARRHSRIVAAIGFYSNGFRTAVVVIP